jgi:oligoendopeptidase F
MHTLPTPAFAPLDAAAGDAALPVWDLSDLYGGPDDPKLAADLDRAEADARAFEARLAGSLATLSGDALAQGHRGV